MRFLIHHTQTLRDEKARLVLTREQGQTPQCAYFAMLAAYSRHELEERDMSESTSAVLFDEIVPPRRPWGRVIRKGEILRLVDLEGQQAVDFLCYDADNPADRYSSMNTIKVQGNIYIGGGTVLYADSGNSLFTVVADTFGRHDTIYGCCSRANNQLRYGVQTTETCYDNFTAILAQFDLDQRYIVSNVNFFMSVPIDGVGKAGVADGSPQPGHYVELRAERNVLAVLSNCPQMHNPCNGYNPTPIRVIVRSGP